MTLYAIKPKTERTYVVTKLDDDGMPVANGTYNVMFHHNAKTDEYVRDICTCPAGSFRGKCKHTGMVRQWLAQPDNVGLGFNDQTDKWERLIDITAMNDYIGGKEGS